MLSKINLAGEWGFRCDEEKIGLANKFYELNADDVIDLPSTTSMAKKGRKNEKNEKDYLTDTYAYEGYAWFYKEIELGISDDQMAEIILERTRITRLWVNGRSVGKCSSLCTPHIYDITDYIVDGTARICIMVDNTDYPTKGGHMTSPDTQSNWNGITGEIAVVISEKSGIKGIRAFPDVKQKLVQFEFELKGMDEADIEIWGASSDGKIVDNRTYHITSAENKTTLLLGEDISLWDEFDPVTYTLKACITGSSDISTVNFGVRNFEADGMKLLLNGRQIQLRGKHDGMVFPLTGAAPTTVEEWCNTLMIAKSWGINHYRFHTCCPPDAAFTAADIVGIYMQPELPFWGTVHAADDENFNASEQEYLIEEGRRILKTFGNHPSFMMMSLGNELWGSSERLNEILQEYHSLDSRHLYTQGSNNFQFFPNIQPYDDFFSGVRLSKERLIRGSYAMCDAPLGFVQTDEPNTVHSYDKIIFPESEISTGRSGSTEIKIQYGTGTKKIKLDSSSGGLVPDKPIITHEVGQYCSYPDFNEIKSYTGVLQARFLEIFRRRLSDKNMLSYGEDFHMASGMLAFNCYKLEIEAAMRSEFISGFQLLDIQDFPGQCIALVGMLNSLMQEKSFVKEFDLRRKWTGFCSDAAVFAEIESFILEADESVTFPVLMRYMRPEKLIGKRLIWNFGSESGIIKIPDGFSGLEKIGDITITPHNFGKCVLSLQVENVRPENDILSAHTCNFYDFWVYPKSADAFEICKRSVVGDSVVYITESRDEAEKLLYAGEKVLYLPNEPEGCIDGFYCTDFWCYPMFRSISESMGKEIPVGTLGLFIDKNHPSLAGFQCESYSTPQWYHIVSHAKCSVLDGTSEEFRPIVQVIDNFERNHKLGILYEAKCGSGNLLVCTSRLSEIAERPEVQAFITSLLDYMHSNAFKPEFYISAL